MIFKNNVNLLEDERILGIDFYDKFLILSIEGLTDEEIGEITLHFHIRDEINESYTNLELYEWYTVDAQGYETNVKLSNVSQGIVAENNLFVVATGMCGKHHANRKTYGYSSIISPWGKIINKLEQIL